MGGCGLQLCRSEPVIKGYQVEKVHAETLEEKWGSRVGGQGQDAMPGWTTRVPSLCGRRAWV